MADAKKAVSENVEGQFFVDSTCIDCDTCRQLAPATFADAGSHSYVHTQPLEAEARREALRALVACPTSSIGTRTKCDLAEAGADFPLSIENNVYYCGFNSRKSYGSNSYFVEDTGGNWLIDSPRFTNQLVKSFQSKGGLSWIFLTHRDDVADADRYAKHFNAKRIIHRRDLSAMPDCEFIVEDNEPLTIADFTVISQPGHTAGHMVLLYKNRYLFTGDHLYVNRETGKPDAFRDHCWYSWEEQTNSMRNLVKYNFEWILPGHGERGYISAGRMKEGLTELVQKMERPR